MTRQDREEKKKGEQRKQQREPHGEPHERTVAPPIEREHETRQGIEQEEEKRKRESERR